MIQEGKEPREAALVLEPVYSQYGEFERLVHVLEVQIAHEEDPVRKVELLHRVAELQEVQLEKAREAFDAHARALPFDSANDHTLASLERLADELGAWGEVTRLYDTEIEKLKGQEPDVLIDMALRVAQIYFIQVGDVDSAIARYRTVLEADDQHAQAIEALDQLYEQTERWSDLAEILQKEAQLAPSPEDVLSFQFRLGQVYQHYLGRVPDAIQQYRDILAAAPEHQQALTALELLFAEGVSPLEIGEILEPLYRMSESWDKLVGVHQVQLQHTTDPDERISMMHRVAEIAEDRAGDHSWRSTGCSARSSSSPRTSTPWPRSSGSPRCSIAGTSSRTPTPTCSRPRPIPRSSARWGRARRASTRPSSATWSSPSRRTSSSSSRPRATVTRWRTSIASTPSTARTRRSRRC
ncbi:MAG: hypothetical protein M5U28_06630 [Sandaracinaceae bacterium]|nr:hypothetical protein [Sandaracinaceae bacterium]